MTGPYFEYDERHPYLDAIRDALRAVRQVMEDFEGTYGDAVTAGPNAAYRLQVQLSPFFSSGSEPRRLDRELVAAVRALRVWKSRAKRFSDARADANGAAGRPARGPRPLRPRRDDAQR